MCVSTWGTTLESLRIFKYTANTVPGSPPLLHTLSRTRRLHASGLPVLMDVIGAEKADDELCTPVMDNTKQSHSFILICCVAVDRTEE